MLKKVVKSMVIEWVEGLLDDPDYSHLMLIDITLNEKTGFIRIYIDGDEGVKFSDCQTVSRALEAMLDESDLVPEKYTLEVSSPGVKRPLENIRQFPQHVGRVFSIDWKDKKSENLKLHGVEGNQLIFHSIPKKKNESEVRVIKTELENIREAKVKISFN